MERPRHRTTLTLPDGAIWGYGRAGRPGGRPVLVHHGLIGDAGFGPIWDELGKAAGIEWIMLERPGYGATPPMAMHALIEWPTMVAPLLTALGVTDRFDVVGMSAGACYAYACAAGMRERVGRAAILSGIPFLHAPGVLDAYPPEGQAAYARYVEARDAELRGEFRAFCQNTVAQLSESGEIQGDRMAEALTAVLAHDAAGPAREARLQAIGWGFGPSDVTCTVDIWHFEGDTMVPFEAARRSAKSLRHGTRHFIQGAGHMPTDAMLEEMTAVLARA